MAPTETPDTDPQVANDASGDENARHARKMAKKKAARAEAPAAE